jgi:uroporphyrinogen-III synthase
VPLVLGVTAVCAGVAYPVTSAALREHGVEPLAEADPHTVDGLVAAVGRLLAGSQAR